MEKFYQIAQEHPPTQEPRLSEWLTRTIIELNGVLQNVPNGFVTSVRDIVAISFATQNPVALDTPMKVTFGPAQAEAGSSVSLAADGTLTNLEPYPRGYEFSVVATVGRVGAAQYSYLYLYRIVNGQPSGASLAVSLNNANDVKSITFTDLLTLKASDTVEYFLVRDSRGANDGSILAFIPALITAPPVASVVLVVSHLDLVLGGGV